ncbi:MAG: hypothetical protein AB1Z98_17170 [Nannocystaceae bacterium]
MLTTLQSRARVLLAAACLLATACNRDDGAAKSEPVPNPSPPATDAGSSSAAADPSSPAAQSPAGQDERARLLAWLDPEAVSVAWIRAPQPLRGDALAVVYGLPARAEDLLQAVGDIDRALEAVRPAEAPQTSTWLGSTALASTGRFARRPTVVRPLLQPRAQVEAALDALPLRRQQVDAFDVWEPERVFPYRIVMLGDDALAFIPASEPGSGLRPLAAARDMPPSDVQDQLDGLLGEPGAPVIALFASGPLLHFDLDQDVMAVRFELYRASDGGLDGRVALQVDGDPATAVKALEDREAPEQSDRIRELVKRSAYLVDGEVVQGRLELPATDAAVLLAERR